MNLHMLPPFAPFGLPPAVPVFLYRRTGGRVHFNYFYKTWDMNCLINDMSTGIIRLES